MSDKLDIDPEILESPVFKRVLKEGIAIQDRFSAEPVFAKTGVGYLKSEGVEELGKLKSDRVGEPDGSSFHLKKTAEMLACAVRLELRHGSEFRALSEEKRTAQIDFRRLRRREGRVGETSFPEMFPRRCSRALQEVSQTRTFLFLQWKHVCCDHAGCDRAAHATCRSIVSHPQSRRTHHCGCFDRRGGGRLQRVLEFT